MNYIVIGDRRQDEFVQKINDRLKEGWTLHGPLIFVMGMFYREMVKPEQPTVDYKKRAEGVGAMMGKVDGPWVFVNKKENA